MTNKWGLTVSIPSNFVEINWNEEGLKLVLKGAWGTLCMSPSEKPNLSCMYPKSWDIRLTLINASLMSFDAMLSVCSYKFRTLGNSLMLPQLSSNEVWNLGYINSGSAIGIWIPEGHECLSGI